MTLHPWPLNDSEARESQPILWTGGGALGLLIDTPAVPLRFAFELDDESAPAEPEVAALNARCDAALSRIRELEALLRSTRGDLLV